MLAFQRVAFSFRLIRRQPTMRTRSVRMAWRRKMCKTAPADHEDTKRPNGMA